MIAKCADVTCKHNRALFCGKPRIEIDEDGWCDTREQDENKVPEVTTWQKTS